MNITMRSRLFGVLIVERIIHMIVTKTTNKIPELNIRNSIYNIKFPAFADIKYDGELNHVVLTELDSFCINKYGKQRKSFPSLQIISDELRKQGIRECIMVTELIYGKGLLGNLYDFLSNKTSDSLNLRVFDILFINEERLGIRPLLDRKEIMHDIFRNITQFLAGTCFIENSRELETFYKETIHAGYEGLVVKNADGSFLKQAWAKAKFTDTNVYKVTYIDLVKERIEIIRGTKPIGVKAANKYKKHIKVGDLVTVRHYGVLKSGSLRNPVLIPNPQWERTTL